MATPKLKPIPCPHDVNALLATEHEYMGGFDSKRGGLVWCDECRQWVSFEFEPSEKP